jgi:integrase
MATGNHLTTRKRKPHAARKHTPSVRRPTERLSRAEIVRLIAACGRSPSGLRNSALLALAYRSGLRAAEICGLELADVGLEQAQERGHLLIHVRPEIAKRGRER